MRTPPVDQFWSIPAFPQRYLQMLKGQTLRIMGWRVGKIELGAESWHRVGLEQLQLLAWPDTRKKLAPVHRRISLLPQLVAFQDHFAGYSSYSVNYGMQILAREIDRTTECDFELTSNDLVSEVEIVTITGTRESGSAAFPDVLFQYDVGLNLVLETGGIVGIGPALRGVDGLQSSLSILRRRYDATDFTHLEGTVSTRPLESPSNQS